MAKRKRSKETEFVSVPVDQQLDTDEEGLSIDTDAIDDNSGDDTEDLEKYKDRNGPVWAGPE